MIKKQKKYQYEKLIVPSKFLLLLVIFVSVSNLKISAQNYEFKNGNWFNGEKFEKRTFYSIDGIFSNKKPKIIGKTIDLKNGYVIPPFADAHTHNLDGTYGLERMTREYLKEGTFYVQVLGNKSTGAIEARPFFNKSSSLDVTYANGMLTCTYGHPFMVYEPLAMGIYRPQEAQQRLEEIKKSRLVENNAYYFLDSKADVDEKWNKILAEKPDIIKIGLLDAKNYNFHLANDDKINKGLSPEVAKYVIKKAHHEKLRVYAHIETADDFRIGLDLGVDGFAHAPYYGWNGSIETAPNDSLTIKDIKRAARKKVVVIPTAQRGTYGTMDYDSEGKGTINEERFQHFINRQRRVFREMHKNGVKLAFGLDNFGSTLISEIVHFHNNKIFDDATLLKISTEITPQSIFPNRKIGKLHNGYEASFLVLKENPLEDFQAITKIELRFKQGVFINLDK